jgi:hypothetical protein
VFEFIGKQCRDEWSRLNARLSVEKQSAKPTGQDILDGPRRFESSGPDNLTGPEGEPWMDRSFPITFLGEKALEHG